jgi:peptidoglycan hydrolase-like protein with peptidoglycan-binding domain
MDLQKGSIGWLVKMLQEDLNLVGYPVTVDGGFGPLTEAAVKSFQAAQGITVDGIVGPDTWVKMETAITAIRQQLRSEANHKLLGTISGQVVGDAFYFGLEVKSGAGVLVPVIFLCDTGAFEMLLTAGTAGGLGLPNQGPMNISGVGGAQSAYNTTVTFKLGDNEFTVPACVDESTAFGINLFGLRFSVENQLTLQLDLEAKTLSFYAYVVPQTGNPPQGASYIPPS